MFLTLEFAAYKQWFEKTTIGVMPRFVTTSNKLQLTEFYKSRNTEQQIHIPFVPKQSMLIVLNIKL